MSIYYTVCLLEYLLVETTNFHPSLGLLVMRSSKIIKEVTVANLAILGNILVISYFGYTRQLILAKMVISYFGHIRQNFGYTRPLILAKMVISYFGHIRQNLGYTRPYYVNFVEIA